MQNLLRSVTYWHIEEESYFWTGSSKQAYLDELAATRTAILAGNPAAKIILIGLSSDQVWDEAYLARKSYMAPWSQTGTGTDTSSAALPIFKQRAIDWIGSTSLYDVIDFHSYERADVIAGKVAWVRSLLPANTTKDLWCMEAGGPFEATAGLSNGQAIGYSDKANSWFVYRNFSEAFANGISRYAWEFYPPGAANTDQEQSLVNVALTADTYTDDACSPIVLTLRKKTSYATIKEMGVDYYRYGNSVDERFLLPALSGESWTNNIGWQPDTAAVNPRPPALGRKTVQLPER